jgi:hypothetical protein
MWLQFFQHILFETLFPWPDDWGSTVKSEERRKKSFSSPACAQWYWSPLSLLLNAYQRLVPRGGMESSQGIQLIIHLHLVPRLSIHGPILLLLSRLQSSNPKPVLLKGTSAVNFDCRDADTFTETTVPLNPTLS